MTSRTLIRPRGGIAGSSPGAVDPHRRRHDRTAGTIEGTAAQLDGERFMARLMSSTELYRRIEKDEDFVLIDVLSPDKFQKEHIPGALNVPLTELRQRAKSDLSKNQRIVVYGTDHDDTTSNEAANMLEEIGFRKVADFDGGLKAWKRAGFLTEGSDPEVIGEMAELKK